MNPASLSRLDTRDIDDVLAQATRFASELRGARVLVTGATGWFGTWLLDALVALNRAKSLELRIVAVSRRPDAFARLHPELHAADEIEWIAADVRDASFAIDGPITHVVHAATEASAKLNAENPDRMFDTIVSGTRNLLRWAALHRDAKILLISSGAVYGVQPLEIERLSEDYRGAPDVLDPGNAYAEGKRAAEQLAAIWHATRGLHITIARCFAFVGPHMPFDAHFAIGNFIRDVLEGDEIHIKGDGKPLRSYLYMSDLVVWLLTILIEGRAMRPYNVGAEEAVSIAALATRCAAASGREVRVRIDGNSPGGRHFVPDTTRAREELGLGARVSLDDAIGRTLDWKLHVSEGVSA